MLKRLLKDSGIYGVANLLSRGISLLLVPFYTQVFSPRDYGVIDILAMVSSVVSIVFGMEITQAVARFYPDSKSKRDAQEYASTALYFTLLVFLLFLLIGFALSAQLSKKILDSEIPVNIFRVALIGIALQSGFYFVQNLLRWRLEPKSHSLCSLVYSFSTIITTMILVLYFHTGVIGVFYGQIVGGLVGFALGVYLCRTSFILYFDVKKLKEMILYSFPLVPSGIGIFALTFADRISIKSMMSLYALGIFGIGYRVSSVISIIMGAFSSALTPLIFSKYKESGTPEEIARIFRYFIFFALGCTSSITLFSGEIIKILTTEQYFQASEVLPFLVSSVFLSGMYIFTPGIDIAKKTKYYAIINVAGSIINISLNIILIPVYGIIGAALATLISSLLIFVTIFCYSQKFYRIPHNISVLTVTVSICFSLALLGREIEFGLLLTFLVKLFILVFSIVISWKLLGINELQLGKKAVNILRLR